MKKAIIYVFSGTGNTRFVAELYKKYLTDYETTIYDVRSRSILETDNLNKSEKKLVLKKNKREAFFDVPSPNDFDLIGFGHPVYGFNVPLPFFEFAKLLPKVQEKSSKKAFVFKTSGEGLYINEFSSQKLIALLEKTGLGFVSDRHYVMPYNLIFRHTPSMVKREALYANAYAKLSCAEILADKKQNVHISPFLRFWVPLFRIEWLYYRIAGPTLKVDMEKCVLCHKCEKNCPTENIHFDGKKFIFGHRCTMCTACSFGCPKCAISIGLLNGWRINGSYQIEKTSLDANIETPQIGKEYDDLHPWLYKKYYRKIDKKLLEAGISL